MLFVTSTAAPVIFSIWKEHNRGHIEHRLCFLIGHLNLARRDADQTATGKLFLIFRK